MSKFFEILKKGLEEAIAHEEGKIPLTSETIQYPEPTTATADPALTQFSNKNKTPRHGACGNMPRRRNVV